MNSANSGSLKKTSEFANDKLAEVVESAEVRPVKSLLQSALYEIGSWLVLPGVIVFFIIAMILFESTIGSICTQPDISLWYFILHSLGRVACGGNLITPVYGVLKILMITGTFMVAASVFFKARRNAKRYRLDALGNLRKDSRDPVLYLRSFSMDVDADPERRSFKTDEEDLALALNHLGPVVAIGAPQEKEGLPLLGATRIYLAEDKWQESVERLISISKLVVIQAGLSEGLIWEVGKVAQKVDPTKLLISLLGWKDLHQVTQRARYLQFKEKVSQRLAETGNSRLVLPDDRAKGSFIVFAANGKPELVTIRRWRRWLFYFSKSLLINETLRPVLRKRGLYLRRWKTFLYCGYILSALFPALPLYPTLLLLYFLIEKVGLAGDSVVVTILGGLLGLYMLSLMITYLGLLYWLLAKLLAFLARLIAGRRSVSVPSILD